MANGDAFADVEHVPDETTPRSLSATPGGGDTGEDHVGGAADGHQEIRAVPSNTSLSGSYVSSVDVDDPPIVQEEPGALPVADGNGGNDANDDDRDGDDDILSKVAQSDIGDDAIEERTSTVAVGQQAESDIYQAHASGSGGTGNAHGVCTVRVAQVERDYRRGFACEFRTEIPPQLQGKLPALEFASAIESINGITTRCDLLDTQAVIENLLAYLSCYTSLWCVRTKWQKGIAELDEVITEMNRRLFLPNGLLLVHPKQNGFRIIDVVAI